MVQLSTLLIIPATFLLVQLSVADKYCPDDIKHSGCWMCKSSDLGKCWHKAVKKIDEMYITDDVQKSAETFCRGFAKLAKCWTDGTCCSEYAPLLAAATNLCNLKTRRDITKDQLKKFVGIANSVRNAIWHNDSGVNVPKLAVTVKAYHSDDSESSQSDSYSAKTNGHTDKSIQNPDAYHKKLTQKSEPVDEDEEGAESNEPADHGDDYNQKKSPNSSNQIHAFHPKLIHRESENKVSTQQVEAKGKKLRHQAKCVAKANKCETNTADKYHQARSSKSQKSVSQSLDKRSSYPHHDPYLFKRTKITPEGCGLDFQGVPYPKEVPETVAKVYSEL